MTRCLVTVLVVASITLTAQAPPSITAFTINNGAAETTSDTVTLRFTYTNPAAIGQPIAQYRLRYKPPTMTAWLAFGQWLTGPMGTPTLSMTLARNGTTPIAGEHRYQLQIRDVKGQVSGTAEAVIRRVLPGGSGPAPTLLQTYRVTGSQVAELVRLARQKGFQFAALPVNGNSSCSADEQTNRVVLEVHERTRGIEVPKPTCRFRMFEGRSLTAGWRQATVALAVPGDVLPADSSWVFEQPLKAAGTDPSFVLYATVTELRGPPLPLSIPWMLRAIREVREIVLTGPAGKTWRQAFEP
ncbi:MAG: hypothetical protein AB7U83_21525 [Vicinamibacterales bacterium]